MDFKRVMQNLYDIFMRLTAICDSDLDFYGHLMRTECNSNLILKIVSTLKQRIKGLSLDAFASLDSKATPTSTGNGKTVRIMETGEFTAKLRDAVPVHFIENGKEIKRYKNIEIPGEWKVPPSKDFKFDVPMIRAITFKIIFEKEAARGCSPEP